MRGPHVTRQQSHAEDTSGSAEDFRRHTLVQPGRVSRSDTALGHHSALPRARVRSHRRGVSDDSASIIERHEADLAYWVSEPDEGHAHALNKGFARTTGEIMCWINSSDMYYPWTFETVAEVFAEFPQVDWITGTSSMFDARGRLRVVASTAGVNVYDILAGDYRRIQQESVSGGAPCGIGRADGWTRCSRMLPTSTSGCGSSSSPLSFTSRRCWVASVSTTNAWARREAICTGARPRSSTRASFRVTTRGHWLVLV